MPTISDALQGHDLGFLKIVAYAWGVELNAPDAATARAGLEKALNDANLVREVSEVLPVEARDALGLLQENEGRLPWSLFTRRCGEVRAMGPARRDRERPDLKPASPAEMLWYRTLIGRAFMDLPPEPQEYAYIPDEFLALLQPQSRADLRPLGRPASPVECAVILSASDVILEHACSLLAGLRASMVIPQFEIQRWNLSLNELHLLLVSAHLLDMHDMPLPEPTRAFLEAPRPSALAQLAKGWIDSEVINELKLVPGLKCEGDWSNNARQTRQTVLDLLSHIPQQQWWSLPAFLQGVHDQQPDFQRPAGDYDSWFIRQESSGAFLRGFASWYEVDGALLRYFICGPLHWLGMLDLARSEEQGEVTAFRLTSWAPSLWHGEPPEADGEETPSFSVSLSGRLRFARLASRAVRYQAARFCTWEPGRGEGYHYRITPAGLERARLQGLKPAQLAALLRKHCPDPIPPALLQAIDRWDAAGAQAKIERVSILSVGSSGIIEALKRSRGGKYIVAQLNPTTVVIREGSEEQVSDILVELGFLPEISENS